MNNEQDKQAVLKNEVLEEVLALNERMRLLEDKISKLEKYAERISTTCDYLLMKMRGR